jgi:hypothetical protein
MLVSTSQTQSLSWSSLKRNQAPSFCDFLCSPYRHIMTNFIKHGLLPDSSLLVYMCLRAWSRLPHTMMSLTPYKTAITAKSSVVLVVLSSRVICYIRLTFRMRSILHSGHRKELRRCFKNSTHVWVDMSPRPLPHQFGQHPIKSPLVEPISRTNPSPVFELRT